MAVLDQFVFLFPILSLNLVEDVIAFFCQRLNLVNPLLVLLLTDYYIKSKFLRPLCPGVAGKSRDALLGRPSLPVFSVACAHPPTQIPGKVGLMFNSL